MPLVDMRDMLYHAYENNYAVGAFDFPDEPEAFLEFQAAVLA